MDTLVSQQPLLHYQDQSRPGSSSSTTSTTFEKLPYPPSSQSSFTFQQRYPQPLHQQPPRKESPGSSSLQITTNNSAPQDLDADEQTAHPSRMQQQFPLPSQQQQQQQHVIHTGVSDPQSIKSSTMTGLSRSLTHKEQELLNHLDRLKFFLATAPSRWNSEASDVSDQSTIPVGHPSSTHPALNRFLLPNSEYVSCVLWKSVYHITGTDIVRALVFRFEAFGRPVRNMKKFEEGVFSDLRNLKPGPDACLEEPKSPFLDLLFKYQCIRTQKKQKVFYWFSVPHDRLFLDALERDLKREKMGLEATTFVHGEPALSFIYDPKRSLYEQFCKGQAGLDGLETIRRVEDMTNGEGEDDKNSDNASSTDEISHKRKIHPTMLNNPSTPFASMFSLFEGSPTYKQRRKKTAKKGSSDGNGRSGSTDDSSEHYSVGPLIRDIPTAADMFFAQARGEYALNERLTQPRAASIQIDHQKVHSQSRGRLESRSTYPVAPQAYLNAHRSHSLHSHTAPLSEEWPYADTTQNTITEAMSIPSSTRIKVFVCPLYSCSKMFKRMEHLKRHMKTHTFERSFPCPRCNKKFSRLDNLNQHHRIHLKMDAEGTSGAVGFINGIVDEGILDDGMNADVEDVDELEGENRLLDTSKCEREIGGHIHEVQGDEEGLLTTGQVDFIPDDPRQAAMVGQQDIYYSGTNNGTSQFPLSSSPEPASYPTDTSSSVSWVTRSASSPAFSSTSMPSPQTRMSSVGPVATYNSMGEYSVSAPSHKATFDHGSIYPSHLQGMSPGPGPVRRHRSVTPSVARYGESIRRPYSAAMTDLPAASSRPYHPYAISTGSHSSSAQSSPGSYHMPLDYGPAFSGQIPVTLARSGSGSRPGSSHLQDQMSQMLNLDTMDTDNMGYTSESSGNGYGGIYRTDSPANYANTNGTYVATADGSPGQHAAVLDNGLMYGMHYGSHPVVDHSFYGQGHPQSVPM